MKRMIPLILMLAMLFTGCASGTIQDGESLSIEPKPEIVKSPQDPWHSIDEQVENAPQVELTRVTATDALPAACIFAEEAPETAYERLPVEPGFEPVVIAIAGQAEADPPVKVVEDVVAVVEDVVAQGQELIVSAAPQSAPSALKSSVSWNPAPRRETATPVPTISVGFVSTCPPEPTATAAPQPEQTAIPESDPGASSVAWQPRPSPGPVVAPETLPVQTVPPEPAVPAPAPEPAAPAPEPAASPTPSGGYAVCSCGATILPDELVAHMKAHALKGESHSYVAY